MDLERNWKRAGAWALDSKSPEVKQGFLLNHLINELLQGDGLRWSNPIQ